jgi:hypothetical protein
MSGRPNPSPYRINEKRPVHFGFLKPTERHVVMNWTHHHHITLLPTLKTRE